MMQLTIHDGDQDVVFDVLSLDTTLEARESRITGYVDAKYWGDWAPRQFRGTGTLDAMKVLWVLGSVDYDVAELMPPMTRVVLSTAARFKIVPADTRLEPVPAPEPAPTIAPVPSAAIKAAGGKGE